MSLQDISLAKIKDLIVRSDNILEDMRNRNMNIPNDLVRKLLNKQTKSYIFCHDGEFWIVESAGDMITVDEIINDPMTIFTSLCYTHDWLSIVGTDRHLDETRIEKIRDYTSKYKLGDPILDKDRLGVSKENAKMLIFGSDQLRIYDPDITKNTSICILHCEDEKFETNIILRDVMKNFRVYKDAFQKYCDTITYDAKFNMNF